MPSAGFPYSSNQSHRSSPILGEMDSMKLPRRKFLQLAAGAAAVPALSGTARAQSYPARPVRILVGYPPGGVNDLHGRLFGQWLSERLGQQFFVENCAGAGGTLAAEAAAPSGPAGYSVLITTPGGARENPPF